MTHLIALVEDSPAEAEVIQEYCKRYSAENSVNIDVKWFPKGETFLRDYQPIYDLVLMDINLPVLNGMDTAARLRRLDSSVALIFITSMARYAIRGYEVEAMDFLLKPVSYPMFSARIQRALRKSSQEQPQTLLINMSDGVYRIASTRIKYVEVTDHYLVQLCANNDSISDCQGNTFIRPFERLCCNVILLYKAQYTVF